MAFDLGQVVIRVDSVKQALADTKAGLQQTQEAAGDTAESMGKLGQAAGKAAQDVAYGMKTAAGTVGATGETFSDFFDRLDRDQARVLQRIRGPWELYQSDLRATTALMQGNQITTSEYESELGRLQQRLAGIERFSLTPELKREADILERINGPMREYQDTLKALGSLLAKEQIDLADYNRELERAQKLAGRGMSPVQGPKQQTPGEESPGSTGYQMSTVQSVVGGAGMLLAGAGVVALGEQIEGLIKNYHDLQDVAIEATNAAMKFSDATHTATQIIDEQIRAAHDLHSNYTTTIGLYDTVRDGTDELNISHADQIRLTKTLGEAVQLAGRSMESAEGVVMRLSYAFARGKIEVGDLNRIMRQVPELGDLWTKAFDTDRQGLLAMVREGKIGVEDIVNSLVNEGKALDDNFAKRQRTNKQLEDEWILNEKLYSQRYGVSYGAGHAAQAAVEALKQNPEQLQFALGGSGPGRDLAEAANKQLLDEQKAALGELFQDLQKLEGPFQKLGDSYRKMTGDTAAVRAEVTKLTEPVEAARAEMDTLNLAFAAGKIDIETYEKEFAKLQTTLQHGIPPEAYKLNAPIEAAKKSLEDLNGAFNRGDVTFDQYRKEYTSLSTTIEGHMPVLEKIRQPIEDARVAFAELQKEQKAGTITSEEYRKEYDALITTMNDGRLPSVIKLWESFTIPIRDWKEDISGLTILWEQGRISLLKYTDEMTKLVHTQSAYLQQQVDEHMVPDWMRQRWQDQTRTAFGGSAWVLPDARADLDRYKAAQDSLRQSFAYGGDKALAAGVSGRSDVQSALKVLAQQNDVLRNASPEWAAYNQQQERAEKLASELVAPAAKYEQTLGDITRALELNSVTEEQASTLRRRARTEYNNEMEALEATKGPMEAYQAALKKLSDQLQAGDISQKQFGQGVDKAQVAMLQATGQADEFSGAMKLAFIEMKGEADRFGASVAKLVTGDLDKFNDAITAAANGGQVSWGQMADAMIQDLERLALKMLEIRALKAIFGGDDTGTSSGGGDALGAAIGAGSLIGQLAGMAEGGTGVVPGSGTVDSKIIAFRATPGERITVTPPGAYPYMPASSPSVAAMAMMGQAPVVQIHNHLDSSVAQAAMDSPGGQKSVINTLRVNAAAARQLTSKPRRA